MPQRPVTPPPPPKAVDVGSWVKVKDATSDMINKNIYNGSIVKIDAHERTPATPSHQWQKNIFDTLYRIGYKTSVDIVVEELNTPLDKGVPHNSLSDRPSGNAFSQALVKDQQVFIREPFEWNRGHEHLKLPKNAKVTVISEPLTRTGRTPPSNTRVADIYYRLHWEKTKKEIVYKTLSLCVPADKLERELVNEPSGPTV